MRILLISVASALIFCSTINPLIRFQYTDIQANEKGSLSFQTVNEHNDLVYYVEQLQFNRWVTIQEVTPHSEADTNNYVLDVQAAMHSGYNKFRIKRQPVNYVSRYSSVVEIKSTTEKVYYFKKGDNLYLSEKADYKLVDKNGMILKSGFGSSINITSLESGKYSLCVDNQVLQVRKSFITF